MHTSTIDEPADLGAAQPAFTELGDDWTGGHTVECFIAPCLVGTAAARGAVPAIGRRGVRA